MVAKFHKKNKMIEEIVITSPKDAPFGRVSTLFKNGTNFRFTPGLNLIVGPNGSGKSTLMEMMKTYLIIPGGKDCVDTSAWEHNGLMNGKDRVYPGVKVKADYRSNSFVLPDDDDCFVNSVYGGCALAYEKATSCKSYGQKITSSVDLLFERMAKLPATVDYFAHSARYETYNGCNAFTTSRARSLRVYIEENRIQYNGICTVILDEPDRNLDLFKVNDLAKRLVDKSTQFQILAVVHNPLLICRLKDKANFVQMEDGYLAKVLHEVKNIVE